MAVNFAHLHLHTKYSALDGAIKINELADRLTELGMEHCAITDHGSMFGVVEFYKTMKSKGIKPIIGSEFYIAPASRLDKSYKKGDMSYYHLVLLAMNNIGLKNLFILSSIGYVEGFYYKPRIDKEVLRKHSEGIIGLSACLAGEVPNRTLKYGYEDGKNIALEYEEILGKGNFYLELQDNGIKDQYIVNKQLIEISKETGIELVATADCHYLKKDDSKFHKLLMRIQYGSRDNSKLDDTDKADSASFSDELFVKSFDEMNSYFKDYQVALDNTIKIAERCNVDIEFGKLHLPIFQTPDGSTPELFLRKLATDGLKKRLERVEKEQHQHYIDRLEEELEVILNKGFDSYFLIVWDFIKYAKDSNVPVGPGRGSGAGSLVAYSIGITDIDPMRFHLLFERFLNPERESMPDFDIDFCIRGREEIIEYVTKKYGEDKVSQIVTFSTLKPRNAIRDIGRIMNLPISQYDMLAKLLPSGPTINTFADAFKADPLVEANIIKAVPEGAEVLKYAQKIEGLIRQIGVHAAGVVIADNAISSYAPLAKAGKKEIIVQFEKDTAEKIGLIKFDFLGLKNLTIINDAIKRIHEEVDPNFDIATIPLDDADVYSMLASGDSTGVFQLESDGMRTLLKKLKPTVFEDIIAVNALYRPGPINSGMLDDFVERKHGRQKISHLFKEIEPILKETYGVIVYQEQVMQIARVLGGYSLGAADILRRAMGKKKADIMALEKDKFLKGSPKENIKGAESLGFDLKKASEVFDLMAQFAEYGFNKSHSAAYALIAYQTAYLKIHYPNQYMPAVISGDLANTSDVVKYLNEAKNMGYTILKPNINESFTDFRYKGNKEILFGLGAIKNIGTEAIQEVVDERDKTDEKGNGGKYKNIYDLTSRLSAKTLNRKLMEALIYSGALDVFEKYRSQLLAVYIECVKEGSKASKQRNSGLLSITDFMEEDNSDEVYPNIAELQKKELLFKEKEVLGFFLSDNPLNEVSPLINLIADDMPVSKGLETAVKIIVVGMIKSIRQLLTKKQEKMAFVSITCLNENIDKVIVFPKLFNKVSDMLIEDEIIAIKGEVEIDSSRDVEGMDENISYSMKADYVMQLPDVLEAELGGIIIKMKLDNCNGESIPKLKKLFKLHAGKLPVTLLIEDDKHNLVQLQLGDEFKIRLSLEALHELKTISGFLSIEKISKSDRLFLQAEYDEAS